jgi:GNAT superfamily N-acetyltransferase
MAWSVAARRAGDKTGAFLPILESKGPVMSVRPVPLIAGPRKGKPPVREALLDDLRHLKERHGEMIAAVDEDTGNVIGTIGIYPDRDEGGACFHLAGIEVQPGHGQEGIDALLLEEAGRYLRAHHTTRLKFGTSPLLTRSAALYVTRFGARYRWREGTRTPDGQPWPYVACECDFDDPLARPLDLREEEVPGRSVVEWNAGQPSPRARLVYSGPLSVLLPELDGDALARARETAPGFIATLFSALHSLHVHGYEFAWFDRLPGPGDDAGADPAAPRWYYIMKRIVAF